MDIIRRRSIVLFLVFLFSTQNYFILSLGMNIICKPSERRALLSFKHLNDPFDSLSSWSGENCCSWVEIVCSNTTDHVIQLQLQELGLGGELNPSLQELKQLRHLDLSFNDFDGILPEWLYSLTNLQLLDLSYNQLSGPLPDEQLEKLQYLEYLSLRSNSFSGSIPFSIGRLTLLTHLDLSRNQLTGCVSESFRNLSKLETLILSYNSLEGNVSEVLKTSFSYTTTIYLNSNKFNGPLPRLASGVEELDLSNNSFSGPISALVCNPWTTKVNYLQILDLSNNLLSGDLSDCWLSWTSLRLLRLESNNITGKIPSSMGSLLELQSLHLQNNTLSGELPLSLRNCTSLKMIDIGENVLTGRLPIWLGGRFRELIVLRLRLNMFHGEIPQELCDLTSLQILDLAHNNLSGSIPRCFNTLRAMATKQNSSSRISYSFFGGGYIETTSLVMQGREIEYSNTLRLVTSMDLSKNYLSGEIPEELASLIGLRFLNLSENHFTGKIPEKIGDMVLLESLDFSNNNISGVIPRSISGLYSLSHLNLSYNNLSGKIPLSTQLQSFNMSIYIGNQELCGPPLNKCNGEEPSQKKPGDNIGDKADEDEDWFEMKPSCTSSFRAALRLQAIYVLWGLFSSYVY